MEGGGGGRNCNSFAKVKLGLGFFKFLLLLWIRVKNFCTSFSLLFSGLTWACCKMQSLLAHAQSVSDNPRPLDLHDAHGRVRLHHQLCFCGEWNSGQGKVLCLSNFAENGTVAKVRCFASPLWQSIYSDVDSWYVGILYNHTECIRTVSLMFELSKHLFLKCSRKTTSEQSYVWQTRLKTNFNILHVQINHLPFFKFKTLKIFSQKLCKCTGENTIKIILIISQKQLLYRYSKNFNGF